MKSLVGLMLVTGALAATVAFGEERLVSKDSEEWGEIYQPPHREPTEVAKGSDLRKALFNQLRPKISALVDGKAILFSGSLKAYRNWAFFSGETVDAKGNPVAIGEIGNSETAALWIRTVDGWRLVDFSGGHSDVFYVVWPEQFGVPKALLGFE